MRQSKSEMHSKPIERKLWALRLWSLSVLLFGSAVCYSLFLFFFKPAQPIFVGECGTYYSWIDDKTYIDHSKLPSAFKRFRERGVKFDPKEVYYLAGTLSPDRKWLFGLSVAPASNTQSQFKLLSVDGLKMKNVLDPKNNLLYCQWIADTDEWIVGYSDQKNNVRAEIRRLNSAEVKQTALKAKLNPSTKFAGVTPGRRLILFNMPESIHSYPWEEYHELPGLDYDLATDQSKPISIKSSGKTSLAQIQLSPDGTKLVYSFNVQPKTGAFFEKIQHTPHQVVYISRADGRDARVLISNYDPKEYYYTLQWLPGGKAVSYIFNRKLYKIPVY